MMTLLLLFYYHYLWVISCVGVSYILSIYTTADLRVFSRLYLYSFEKHCLEYFSVNADGTHPWLHPMVIGQVEPFQLGTEDREQYTKRLEQFFLSNGIDNDRKKLAVILKLVGAKTYV